MNILLIGAGGVGLGIASSVISQGAEVSIYATGETAKAIKKNGIRRTGLFTHYSFENVPVFESYADIPKDYFDYIFIASKTTANAEIAKNLNENRLIFKQDTKIIIFQNGFGNDDYYLKYFPKEQVFVARVITGFTRPERHISEVTVYTEPILLGSLQKEDPEQLTEIAEMITASGINCEVTDEIDKYLWAKMLYNCSLNPLGAILDVTYGKLTENDYTIEIMNRIIDEIFDVIKASGYETLWDSPDDYRKLFYSKLVPDTYNHYSSTHQDIQRKIKTEIDSLNGKVIELGEKNSIDVSTNKIIYNLIKAIENEF
ncbi:2-dehydropantoate 2-reductase [Methanobrevibacter sp. YE315]|uniref:ketopantoate reductase family protein n=1 Tax=Methanobrevibacter sp. YE315 TaxID=1609968 RepID=UPI000764DA06|nr:ketopantoate reductase family protein [Methanobrevibacter sp. YE315]AMD17476.1 2-dehydropantoate 2-reductase [Methanobrevibacter sp. YE315]